MLEKIRVLDLTTFIAGPACPRTLADFGADVIKVEEPGEEPPLWYPNLHIETHRGKRHMVLDIKSAAGRDAFLRLVATADVVVENAKSTVWPAQGLAYEDLIAISPHLLYVSIKAYGSDGPWGKWGGFEPNAQAVTGMQVRFGGADGPPRQAGGGAINDYGAPQLAASAILLALKGSREERRSRRIEAALAWSASLFQSADLFRTEEHEPTPLGGASLRGRSLESRLWPASDGWIYAVLRNGALQRFSALIGTESAPRDDASAAEFECVTSTHGVGALISAALRAGGVAVAAPGAQQLKERLADEEMYGFDHQPSWGSVGRIGYTVKFDPPLAHGWRPAPGWGEHTREILAEIGLPKDDIDELFVAGVAQ